MTPDPGPFDRMKGALEGQGLKLLLKTEVIRDHLAASRSAPVDNRKLDPEIAAMLEVSALMHRDDLTSPDVATARERFAKDVLTANSRPPPVAHEDRLIPSPAGPLGARLYVPPGIPSPAPGIVFFHGGGFVTGSVATHDVLCRRLAHEARCRVISVEYRLAPEHPFPAAAEDAVAAARHILAHAESFGLDPARIAVAGDSAGGNLSAVIAHETRRDARRPRLQVLIYPALDLTFSAESHRTFADGYLLTRPLLDWYKHHYLRTGDPRDPRISPLFHPEPTDVPALVYTAGFDPLRDEAQLYADRLRAAGTPVTYREFSGLVHGFALMTALAAPLAATNAIAVDIRRELEG